MSCAHCAGMLRLAADLPSVFHSLDTAAEWGKGLPGSAAYATLLPARKDTPCFAAVSVVPSSLKVCHSRPTKLPVDQVIDEGARKSVDGAWRESLIEPPAGE